MCEHGMRARTDTVVYLQTGCVCVCVSAELAPSVSFAVSRGVNMPSARHVKGSGACASETRTAASLFVHA